MRKLLLIGVMSVVFILSSNSVKAQGPCNPNVPDCPNRQLCIMNLRADILIAASFEITVPLEVCQPIVINANGAGGPTLSGIIAAINNYNACTASCPGKQQIILIP